MNETGKLVHKKIMDVVDDAYKTGVGDGITIGQTTMRVSAARIIRSAVTTAGDGEINRQFVLDIAEAVEKLPIYKNPLNPAEEEA